MRVPGKDDNSASGFGSSWVLDPTGAGLSSFFHPQVKPEPHRTGFGCVFHFSAASAPKTRKEPRKNQKYEKTPKGTRKTQNPKKTPIETRKKSQKKHIYKTQRAPDPDLKPDGFRFGCQISPMSAGSDVKFNLSIFFHRSDFWSIRPEPGLLSSLVSGNFIHPGFIFGLN
jgi:hypothetical protein